MGIGEIAYRSRQEANKLFERVGGNGNGHAPGHLLRKSLASDALRELRGGSTGAFRAPPSALLEHFKAPSAKRFFPGAADPQSTRLLREHAAEACTAIVDVADKAPAGRFKLLGYYELFLADPGGW